MVQIKRETVNIIWQYKDGNNVNFAFVKNPKFNIVSTATLMGRTQNAKATIA